MYAVDGNTIHVVMNALVVGGNQCGQKYISDVSTLFEEKQRKHDNEWLHQMTIDKLIKKIRPCERACIIIDSAFTRRISISSSSFFKKSYATGSRGAERASHGR
jgi:hypothetical protein